MKDIVIALFGLALSAALFITPIVIAWIYSPLWLFLEVVTFPFAVAYFVGATSE